MRKRFPLMFLLTAFLSIIAGPATAMWKLFRTEAVPVARLLANLESRLALNTNDVEVLYHLARVHSMAYSTNLQTVNIVTNDEKHGRWPIFSHPGRDLGIPTTIASHSDPVGKLAAQSHLTNAIAYYERASSLSLQNTNDPSTTWLTARIQLGLAWSLDQAGRRQEAVAAYREALQLAWQIEVDGTRPLRKPTPASWDEVRAIRPSITPQGIHLGPGICFSQEIIGYLLALLDPAKEAGEIAQLKQDKLMLASIRRPITPILIPLQPETPFEELVDPAANVAFDLDGSGLEQRWGWITPKAAWLVFDQEGTGRITSGLQMFGNVTFWLFWRDGYDALSSLDDNGDGRLSGSELRGLSLWHDLNGNGISDPGEVRPLADYGITAIGCSSQPHPDGFRYNPRGVIFKDGASRPTYDWFAPLIPAKASGGGAVSPSTRD